MKKILNLVLIGMLLAALALGFGSMRFGSKRRSGDDRKIYQRSVYLDQICAGRERNRTDHRSDGRRQADYRNQSGRVRRKRADQKNHRFGQRHGDRRRRIQAHEALEEITLPFVGAEKETSMPSACSAMCSARIPMTRALPVTQSYNASSSETYYFPQTLTKVTDHRRRGLCASRLCVL